MIKTVEMNAPVYGVEQSFERKDFGTKVALIDADYLKYMVASSIYKRLMDEGEDCHSIEMVEEVIDFYLSRDIFNAFHAKAYVFCFSAPSKQIFRHQIAQESKYKGNRDGRVDSTFYEEKYRDMAYTYEYINKRYQALIYDDIEADDLLSFLQDKHHTFIFSKDKDLKQVPGYYYDMERRVLDYVSEEEGFIFTMKQTLTGDTTDGIPGLKGCGPKRVEAISSGIDEAYPMLISTLNEFITKKGLVHGLDTFVEMYGLVSMRINRGDYFKEKYGSAINLIQQLINQDHE